MPNQPLKSANSRVFLQEGRAAPYNAPTYQSCFRMTGLGQGFGDITKVECPDPYNYGKFIEVAQIKGATERVTTSLEGRYYMDLLSTMMRLSRQGCPIDVQLHLGSCTDPSDFNSFTKAVVLEEASITNYSTEDLGVLSSGDNAVVNETVDISAANVYEVRPMTFTTKGDSVVTNEILGITFADAVSCSGDACLTESDGATYVFAISKGAGGSPSTPADVLMLAGSTIVVRDIDTLATANDPTGIAQVGNYIVVTSGTDPAYHYALRSSFVNNQLPSWTKVTLNGSAYAISSVGNVAYIVGANGYVYKINSPASGFTVIESGSLTTSRLNAVHAFDADNVLVGGNSGVVMYTTNGSTFALTSTFPVGIGVNITAVFMQTKTIWWVGTSGGKMYYTKNSGLSWTEKTFSGSGSGNLADITFATRTIGYMSHTTAGNVGRIFRTYDGGYSWNLLPEGTGTMPTNQKINRIACTPNDVNRIYGGGLGVSTDGVIVYGSAT